MTPTHLPPPPPLSRQALDLVAQGRAADALALTEAPVARPDAGHGLVAAHAVVLKALGRPAEALTFNRRAARSWPDSPVAWHNLAATLGDMGQAAEALQAIDRALAVGGDAAATWLVRARAQSTLDDGVGAEASFRQALARAPGMTDAACDLAQLIWLRSGDADAAMAHLGASLEAGADVVRVLFIQSQLLEQSGRIDAARKLLISAARRWPDDVSILLQGVRAAVHAGEPDAALAFAEQAQRLEPDTHPVDIHLTIGLLALGRPDEALVAARRAAARSPDAQDAWGWVATAARAAGDPEYERLYDYDTFVRAFDIETPEGWPDLPAYLADLEAALEALHTDFTHRIDQSVRKGTQTSGDLSQADHPAIQAFYTAIDAPIRRYLDEVGQGADPLRVRNTGTYRLSGSWSVRLKAQGHHIDHFHPAGWLSSAFYVRTPEAALDQGEQGWIRFGQSPFPSRPMMAAAHRVRPRPGRLVLFPSYMWHGTVPFEGDETRLTIAFDVVPA